MREEIRSLHRMMLHRLLNCLVVGLSIGGIIEVWRTGLIDSAIVLALLLAAVVQQGFAISSLQRAQAQKGTP